MLRRKRKGRKIYTYRVVNRQVFSRYRRVFSALSTVLTIVGLCLLVIVGYSVIGPLATRLRQEAAKPTQTPNPYVSSTATPATTFAANSESQTTTTTVVHAMDSESVTVVKWPEIADVTDLQQLDSLAAQVSAEGYRAILLPLRLSGGGLTYRSGVSEAGECGAMGETGTLPLLAEYRNIAERYQLESMAIFETTDDALYPLYKPEAGLLLEDMPLDTESELAQQDSLWLTAVQEESGRPWLAPESEAAQQYLQSLIQEIDAAGFTRIVCTNPKYPSFAAADLEAIGTSVADVETRSANLVSMLDALGDVSAHTAYRFDLYAALSKEVPFLQGEQRPKMPYACVEIDLRKFKGAFYYDNVRYDPSKLSFADSVKLVLDVAERMTGESNLIPCWISDGMTDVQLETALDTTAAEGYLTMIVKS